MEDPADGKLSTLRPPMNDDCQAADQGPPRAENNGNNFDQAVLNALVEGFQARGDVKERFRALSEYEVARRVGVVHYSYVEFDSSPEREQIRSALQRLQRQGRVQLAASTGRYDTFVPARQTPTPIPPQEPRPSAAPDPTLAPLPTSFEGRLDEIVRLLRSMDARLERIERTPDADNDQHGQTPR